MVHLILSSAKGNQAGKFFPYQGYLGLTPVRVEGIVRTRLDSDQKTLPCRSLTVSVRCYESRIGRVNTLQSNILVDYTQTLWSKPDDADYENVGALEYPFRIWVPVNTQGFSTAVFVDYRCTWRVEAVLNHVPITGVGSRQMRHFDIPLIRYDVPRPLAPPYPDTVVLDHLTSKPKAPRIRYSLRMPRSPTGPLDLVSVPLHMQPIDPAVSIRSASISIERRIQLHDSSAANTPTFPSAPHSASTSSSPLSQSQNSYFSSSSQQHASSSPSDAPPPPGASSSSSPSPSSIPPNSSQRYGSQSTSSLSSSNPTITPHSVFPSSASIMSFASDHPLLNSSPSHSPLTTAPPPANSMSTSTTANPNTKVVMNVIAGKDTENFARDARGVWSKTLTLQWPAAKSHSRWAVGETIHTSELVSVRFFVRVKITVSSPTTGTDTIELSEQELLVVSTNDSERHLALARYAELAESSAAASASSIGPSASTDDIHSSSAVYGSRGKSKSPGRRVKDRGDEGSGLREKDRDRDKERAAARPPLPPLPSLPVGDRDKFGHPPSREKDSSSRRTKTPRRPHTSAGTRDARAARDAFGAPGSAGEGGRGVTFESSAAKRRSEVGWASGVGVHDGKAGGTPDSLWDGYVRQRPSSSRGAKERPGSSKGLKEKEKEKEKKSGRLSSTSFWAVSAPPVRAKEERGSGSSKEDKSDGMRRSTRQAERDNELDRERAKEIERERENGSGKDGQSHSFWAARSAGAVIATANSTSTVSTSVSSMSSSGRSTSGRSSSGRPGTAGLWDSASRDDDVDDDEGYAGTEDDALRRRRRRTLQPPSSFSARGLGKDGGGVHEVNGNSNGDNGNGQEHHVREWEEELARIEVKSRKESDAAGFQVKNSFGSAGGQGNSGSTHSHGSTYTVNPNAGNMPTPGGRPRKRSILSAMKGFLGSAGSQSP